MPQIYPLPRINFRGLRVPGFHLSYYSCSLTQIPNILGSMFPLRFIRGLTIHGFREMKINRTFIFIICLCLLILPSLKLMLNIPIYPSHDGLIHVERIEQFHQSFLDGQIPPRIAPSLAGSIGFPIFVVNYQLPYYFAEFFMLTIKDPFVAFKSVMAISYFLSAIFAFFLFRYHGSRLASLTGAIVFSYTPYRFANLYTRGALGESTAMMFVPLSLLSIHLISNQRKNGIVLLSLSLFGLITSHTVIFLLFLPFLTAYTLFFVKLNRRILINISFAIILGLLLSSFQLIPVIFEKKYTQFESFLNLYGEHFIGFNQLFRIPKSGITPSSPFQIGLVSSLTVLLSLIFLLFRKNIQVLFFLIMIFLSIFAIHSSSLLFWEHILFLKYINFPWRFLSIIAISAAFLSVYLVNQTRFKMIAFFLITLALFTSRHYFLHPTQYESTSPSQVPTFPNEYDTIWSNKETFKTRPIISSYSQVQISNIVENSFNLSFDLKTKTITKIIIRKIYFPGWKLKLNGSTYRLDQTDGLLSFWVGSGDWHSKVYFTETPIRKLADFVSLVSFLALLGYLLKKLDIFKRTQKHLRSIRY